MGAVDAPMTAGAEGVGGTGRNGETEAIGPSALSGRAPVTRLGAGGGTGSDRVPLGGGTGGDALGSLGCGRESRLGAGGGTLRRGAGGGLTAMETRASTGPAGGLAAADTAPPVAAGGGVLRLGRGGLLREGRGGDGACETRDACGLSPSAFGLVGAVLRRGAPGGIEFGRGRGGAGFFGEGESSAMARVS